MALTCSQVPELLKKLAERKSFANYGNFDDSAPPAILQQSAFGS